ncbi:MAG: ImmA/IrrE family metallo-endopeptidase [Gemmatimonadetes bacterium]|nr:ImmA/IrrE family metallo-endopeptidase [Gemmatimonadota bacterium]MYG84002.1 ImmA/IrrE family metallo-endopeptidase [Gemmatimonadota bacterium]MYJ88365.1 ImmA/IrrE family metallo-endopeptidase [Gemmatimonadota bacterium]
MDLRELGQRLRYAREFRGLSQQATAKAIGVTRTAITQMESGNRSVSTLELSKLAECFRRPISYFFQETTEEEDILISLYRIAPNLKSNRAIRNRVGQCLDLFREGLAMKKILGIESRAGLPVYDIQPPRTRGDAITQGNKAATEERRRLGIGESPIHNITELIVSQGIWASDAKLPQEMSGLFVNHSSFGLAIVVNSDHSRGRKQFSYAHEYAHALMDRDGNLAVSSRENSSELVEVRANAFAASFLMPAGGVYEELKDLDTDFPYQRVHTVYDAARGEPLEGVIRTSPSSRGVTYKDVAKIAHRFGVSYQAALYRMKSLRIVSDQEMDRQMALEDLGKEFLNELSDSESVERRDLKKPSDRELRFEVAGLAIEAFRRDCISQGRLLELSKLLKIDGQQFIDFALKARGN